MSDLYTEILENEKMTFDRQEVIENYAHSVVEGMDLDTLVQFAYDVMVEDLEKLDDEELKEEIYTYHPELLD